MTTRNFSSIKLPHPRYSLEVGKFSIKEIGKHQQEQQQQQQQQESDEVEHQQQQKRQRRQEQPQEQVQESKTNHMEDLNLPSTCLPRFTHLAQVVEARKSGGSSVSGGAGCTRPNRVRPHVEDFLATYIVIENARPELFMRRDFISKFVDNGTIHLAQIPNSKQNSYGPSLSAPAPLLNGYQISAKDNVMIIKMSPKQYRRFGLVAKKVRSYGSPSSRGEHCYQIEIDLKDERIKNCNKYQDRMTSILRRLGSINKVYFRFNPTRSWKEKVAMVGMPECAMAPVTATATCTTTAATAAAAAAATVAANKLSLEFFNYVIDEYACDGCQPVPLTKCSLIGQKIQRHWTNRSQLLPGLSIDNLLSSSSSLMRDLERNNVDELARLVEIVDWLGYQLLSLDCNRSEIWPDQSGIATTCGINNGGSPSAKCESSAPKVDVSCYQLVGSMDYQHVQENLNKLFLPLVTRDGGDDTVLRALILYNDNDVGCMGGGDNNSAVVYLQHCAIANKITVLGMSALPD